MLVMLVVVMMLLHLGQQGVGQTDLFHGRQDGLAVHLIPGGGQNGSVGVLFTQHGNRVLQLGLGQLLGAGQNDGSGVLHLIVVKLAEVLHVHLHLGAVHHGGVAVQLHFGHLSGGLFHGGDDVGQLAHAGGLDQDAVGVILLLHVFQGLMEVAHQTAADAAGGHLGDLHAGLLQETAVNGDLAEFVFDQHQLLAGEGLGKELFDQSSFAGAQKAGDNIDFRHGKHLQMIDFNP